MRKKFLIALGAQIRSIRKSKGISASRLAHSVNKPQQSVTRVENGKICPSVFYLSEIAGALDVTLEELVQGLP